MVTSHYYGNRAAKRILTNVHAASGLYTYRSTLIFNTATPCLALIEALLLYKWDLITPPYQGRAYRLNLKFSEQLSYLI